MFSQKFSATALRFPYMYFKNLKLNFTPNIIGGIFSRHEISYIVLLPEVPEDTAETNPLLNNSELPHFEELTAQKCYSGLKKHCLEYESKFGNFEEKIQDGSISKTSSNIIDELDKLDAPFSYAWNTVKMFYCIKNDQLTTPNYIKLHERALQSVAYKFQSKPLYKACKEIHLKENMNPFQKRVIEKFLKEARLNGMEITNAKKLAAFSENLIKLENQKSKYTLNMEEASKRFSYRIIDRDIVRDFPDDLLRSMAFNGTDYLKGPWTVSHHPMVYRKFLEHCPHKDLRYNAWKAYIRRASPELAKDFNNSILVEEIRDTRSVIAKYLGFKTFIDMSMETKMAGSVENVMSLISNVFVKAKESQLKEMNSLTEFAQSHGFRGDLEECDIPYWRRKEFEYLFSSKGIEIDKYFPFNHVWHQLLAFCSSLFGIHFEEVPCDQVSTWHPDVRFFNIFDSDGNKMSSFYIDPYRRPRQKLFSPLNPAWMLSLKSRRDAANISPVASLIFNFQEPPPGSDTSLLSLHEVETLFSKFGLALTHLLCTVPYGETSGLKNIEWDAVEVSSNFLSNWLNEPSVLEKISKHNETGLPLDKAGIKCVQMARSHMAGYDMCYELFLSHLDIKLYSENDHWMDFTHKLYASYMPFEEYKIYSLPCWFSQIITDSWAAAYYSNLWSKMLAADIFNAFKECDPHEIPTVGRRFKNTFLSMGGGHHSADVFRQFRGRDPSSDALALIFD